MRIRIRSAVAAAVALAAVLALAGVASAAATSHARAQAITVVASGLDNPRGLAFGKNGMLYVAEAGRGGDLCFGGGTTEAAVSPFGAEPPGETCLGLTSKLTGIDRLGAKRTIVGGIISAAAPDGSEAVGLDGISVANVPSKSGPNSPSWGVYGLIALNDSIFAEAETAGVSPAQGTILDTAEQQVGRLILSTSPGSYQTIANIGRINFDWTATVGLQLDPQNPEFPDANPYGLYATQDKIFSVDGGSNTLDTTTPSGVTAVNAWLPNPPLGTGNGYDAVPTCITPSGLGYVVGDFNGRLFRYLGNGALSQLTLTGPTLPLAVGGCTSLGSYLYVTDMFTGNVLSVSSSGQVSVVASGLFFPTGITVGPDRALYVSTGSVVAGAGQVVRIPVLP